MSPPTAQRRSVSRALISVSDKRGVAEFAAGLAELGVELLSTGGTYQVLVDAGLSPVEVSAHTGFPELMDGRVKTLHPKIHAGILARRDVDGPVLQEHGIAPIDLVVVNLYPFEQTIAREDATFQSAIEDIDIGGPAMIRSAAKNHHDVLVVVDPDRYPEVLAVLRDGGSELELRHEFAARAFAHTAAYDSAIADYLTDEPFPDRLSLSYVRREVMRYGENPHQNAAFYVEQGAPSGSVASLRQLQGKALSYNNVADVDAALQCVKVFQQPACVIVKHANPCGVAEADSPGAAYAAAFATDPTSAFGGILAFNRPLDAQTLEAVLAQQFAEVIIAPAVDAAAVEAAKRKKNLRLLSCGPLGEQRRGREFKRVGGGLLVQDPDEVPLDTSKLASVADRAATENEMRDMLFAWKVAWFVKSNAIVYARDSQTIGVGAGQMSRVVSAKIAQMKAQDEGLTVAGSVMASDAFLPFRDSVDAAAQAGITAVIQPGGSVRDEEVITAANEHGMAMMFTGIRHFRH